MHDLVGLDFNNGWGGNLRLRDTRYFSITETQKKRKRSRELCI